MSGSPVGLTIVEIGPIPTDMLDRVYGDPPTERGFRCFRRLQLMPEVPRERVAHGVVEAVERGRRTVRHPRRAVMFPWLTSTLITRRRPADLNGGVPDTTPLQ